MAFEMAGYYYAIYEYNQVLVCEQALRNTKRKRSRLQTEIVRRAAAAVKTTSTPTTPITTTTYYHRYASSSERFKW